ncbi:hypothetical protein HDU96_007406 [Phlyctochytrium bullatum]|nr:hypothetical protein HDU96_007406 [Phlyctochytrium bullatum]
MSRGYLKFAVECLESVPSTQTIEEEIEFIEGTSLYLRTISNLAPSVSPLLPIQIRLKAEPFDLIVDLVALYPPGRLPDRHLLLDIAKKLMRKKYPALEVRISAMVASWALDNGDTSTALSVCQEMIEHNSTKNHVGHISSNSEWRVALRLLKEHGAELSLPIRRQLITFCLEWCEPAHLSEVMHMARGIELDELGVGVLSGGATTDDEKSAYGIDDFSADIKDLRSFIHPFYSSSLRQNESKVYQPAHLSSKIDRCISYIRAKFWAKLEHLHRVAEDLKPVTDTNEQENLARNLIMGGDLGFAFGLLLDSSSERMLTVVLSHPKIDTVKFESSSDYRRAILLDIATSPSENIKTFFEIVTVGPQNGIKVATLAAKRLSAFITDPNIDNTVLLEEFSELSSLVSFEEFSRDIIEVHKRVVDQNDIGRMVSFYKILESVAKEDSSSWTAIILKAVSTTRGPTSVAEASDGWDSDGWDDGTPKSMESLSERVERIISDIVSSQADLSVELKIGIAQTMKKYYNKEVLDKDMMRKFKVRNIIGALWPDESLEDGAIASSEGHLLVANLLQKSTLPEQFIGLAQLLIEWGYGDQFEEHKSLWPDDVNPEEYHSVLSDYLSNLTPQNLDVPSDHLLFLLVSARDLSDLVPGSSWPLFAETLMGVYGRASGASLGSTSYGLADREPITLVPDLQLRVILGLIVSLTRKGRLSRASDLSLRVLGTPRSIAQGIGMRIASIKSLLSRVASQLTVDGEEGSAVTFPQTLHALETTEPGFMDKDFELEMIAVDTVRKGLIERRGETFKGSIINAIRALNECL